MSLPFWTILWKEVGLTHTTAMLGQFLFGVVWVLLELPTGHFADKFGRRKSILLGMFLKFFGHYLYFKADSPLDVFIAEAILATGFSFISGALVALLFDSLQAAERPDEFKKLNARGEVGNFALAAVSSLFASTLGFYGARYAIGSLMVVDILQLLIVLPIIEAPHKSETAMQLRQAIARIFGLIKTSSRFVILIFAPPILIAVAHGSTWFTEPYLTQVGFTKTELGLCYAGIVSIASVITLLLRNKKKFRDENTALIFVPALSLIGSSFSGFLLSKLGALGLASSFAVRAVTPVLFAEAINRETPSDIRATVLSFQNLINRLLVVTAMLVCGVIADYISLQAVFLWTAFLSVLGLFAGMVAGKILTSSNSSTINTVS